MRHRSDIRVIHRKNGTVFTMFRCYRRWFKIPSAVQIIPAQRGPAKSDAPTEDADE